jgi:hypothetical protein
MVKAVRQGNATKVWIDAAYQLEFAVGASHVASMLYPASRNACIAELSVSFSLKHGSADLKQFLLALAEKLDVRGDKAGAIAVRHYAGHGTVPEALAAPTPTIASKKRR